MSRHQVRLLLCSVASVALIVGATLVVAWFRIDFGPSRISIGLRSATMCAPGEPCQPIGFAGMTGFYPIIAAVAYWCGIALALLVVAQLLRKLVTGIASPTLGKIGYGLGTTVFLSAFAAGYLFGPETDGGSGVFAMMGIGVSRTFAAPLLLAGSLLALLAVRYALQEGSDDDAEYKPVVVRKDDGDGRLPTTPLNTGRIATPPSQRERIVTPSGHQRVGAGPRERVPTPGSFERIPPPGREGVVHGPGPRDRKPTPKSFERIPPPGREGVVHGPGPRDRKLTPGSFERLPLPGRDGPSAWADDVAAPRVPDSIPLDNPTWTIDEDEDAIGLELAESGAPSEAGASGRARNASDQPLVARTTSPGGRARTASEEPLPGSGTSVRARNASEQPLVARAQSPGGRARTASEEPLPGSGTSVRARNASDQPLVARTTSPGGRARTASEQPLVARTTSPGGRARTASEEPLVARTTSPPGRARTASEDPLPGSGTSLRARNASDQPLVARTTSPGGRARASSDDQLAARSKSPSKPFERIPDDEFASEAGSQPGVPRDLLRGRTSSSGPIDLAARLSGAPMSVAIKPPLPERIPVPPDQIPVAPESGLVIRKKSHSQGPLASQQIALTARASAQSTAPPAPQSAAVVSQSAAVSAQSAVSLQSAPQSAVAAAQPAAGSPRAPVPPIELPPPANVAVRTKAPSAAPATQPGFASSASDTTPGLASATTPGIGDAVPPRTNAPRSATTRTPAGAMPSIALSTLADDLGDLDLSVPVGSSPASPALKMPPIEDDHMHGLAFENPAATARGATPAQPRSPAPSTNQPPFANPGATARGASAVSPRAPAPSTSQPPFANPGATVRGGAPGPREPGPIPNPTPVTLRNRINYAVITVSLTSAGIHAQREDGTATLVEWEAIVGIVARRLPAEPPFGGFTFVDLVSTAGSTLRILPWTQITGAPLHGEGAERARVFVSLVAAHCLDAKLDRWTKVFADGAGQAAQLQSEKMLATHDERVA